MHKAFFVAAALLVPQGVWAQCIPGETEFASCQIKGKKTQVSVCYTADTATYRFGKRNAAPDLALSVPIVELAYTPWPGIGRDIWESVSFDNKGYTYELSVGFERMFEGEAQSDGPRHFGQLTVTQGTKILSVMACQPETVSYSYGEGLFAAKAARGQQWDANSQVWVAP